MCGILGYFTNKEISNTQLHKLNQASNYLKIRGPDYLGIKKGKKYFLANSRLKIVSRKNYILPLFKHNCYISFSGEILNYKNLKNFLISKKYVFKTETDTEIILSLYDYYGLKFCDYLQGFFAVSIFDIKKNKLILVVDRIGNKNIYYNYSNKKIFFSSEQSYMFKSGFLEFEINQNKVDEHLVFGDIAGSQTLHKNLKKLLPGEVLEYNFKDILVNSYYKLDKFVINSDKSVKKNNLKDSVDGIKNIITSTINIWNNNCAYNKSILLSGGIDSGLIAMVLSNKTKKLTSYTSKFPSISSNNPFNEESSISEMVKEFNIEKNMITCSEDELLNNLSEIYSSFNEPSPSNSLLLKFLTKSMKKKNDQKICFTGDGADEVFGGYERHIAIANKYKYKNDNNIIAMGYNYLSVNRLKKFFNKDFETPKLRLSYLNGLKNVSTVNKILLYDLRFYLPMFLRSMEQIGMASSIEYRSPFTDHKLIEESFRLDDKFKIFKFSNKFILKKVFSAIGNKIIIKKRKFEDPYLEKQFNNGLFKDIIMQLTNNSAIAMYYPVQGIKNLLKDNINARHNNTLMRLVALELFLQSK
tara:strand:+ start:867 stop:2618 length:1752 start_codon:yes stop_codon:yes gene_type:complete